MSGRRRSETPKGRRDAGPRDTGDGEGAAAGRTLARTLLALAGVANAAGYAFHLWDAPVGFDEVVHGGTMLAITFAIAVDLRGRVLHGARWYPVLFVLTVAGVGLGIGALWEIGEWAYDQFYAPGNAILGKWDTITDLIADTVGALLAGAGAAVLARREPHGPAREAGDDD